MRQFVGGALTGFVMVPALFFLWAWFGWFSTNANTTPPVWETALARHALHAATARHAPHLTNPIAATEANLRAGMKLYNDDCAGCHGSADSPKVGDPNLYPDAPAFAQHPPTLPDWQLYAIVKYGVRYSGMFAWNGEWGKDSTGRDLTDERIWTVLTFLKRLDSLPPTVAAEWHAKR